MKKIFLSLFAASSLNLIGCASIPPIMPTDTLAYFTLDVSEMPGAFVKTVFQSTDKEFSVGSAWDRTIRPDQKFIVCYVSVPNDRPVYFSEIHADDSGMFTGRRYEMYVLTPQQSPFQVPKTSIKAGIKYGGAFKFKLLKGDLLASNSFNLERCSHCPSEKEILQHLIKIGNGGGDLLNQNGYLTKLKARLKSL